MQLEGDLRMSNTHSPNSQNLVPARVRSRFPYENILSTFFSYLFIILLPYLTPNLPVAIEISMAQLHLITVLVILVLFICH